MIELRPGVVRPVPTAHGVPADGGAAARRRRSPRWIGRTISVAFWLEIAAFGMACRVPAPGLALLALGGICAAVGVGELVREGDRS